MKKIFTLLSIVYFIPAIVKAQFETGQKVLGGNLSFGTTESKGPVYINGPFHTTSSTGVGVSFSKARFYKPNVLGGMGIFYNHSKYAQKQENSANDYQNKTKNNSVGLSIFSQRFMSLGNRFFFTIQTQGAGSYNWGSQIDEIDKRSAETKGYSLSVGVAPGISYKISDRFLFDAFLNNFLFASYSHSTTEYIPVTTPTTKKANSNSFNISSSLSNTNLGNIGLGFRWLLKRS